jgi:hypothetical protein
MKSNYLMLCELDKEFNPKNFGYITKEEIILVKNILHIEEMDNLALQNLRDMSVMFYCLKIDHTEENEKRFSYMDKQSAICGVIDSEKSKRGMAV